MDDYISKKLDVFGNTEVKTSKSDILDFVALEICKTFKSYFAFKGGYTLSKMLTNPRATVDIDLSIDEAQNYVECKEILINIGVALIDRGLATSYVVKDGITETSSGGITYYNGENVLLGVDVGLHPLSSGVCKLDFRFAEVDAFTPERMLADKISAILSRKRFRRTKDIYDLFCIASEFDIKFELLRDLLEHRIGDSIELWDNIPFNETVLLQYEHAYNKLIITSYLDGSQLERPDFVKVYRFFYKFIDPLKNKYSRSKWDHLKGVWE